MKSCAHLASHSILRLAFFEPRFGWDFSRVRVHANSTAAQSAWDVNANAYTAGQNIVFAKNQYAPGTATGHRLIAHEPTHVIQQGKGQHYLQRWAACYPARLSLLDCPPREPGEENEARRGPMLFMKLDSASGVDGEALIANFDIGSAKLDPSLLHNLNWKEFLRQAVEGRSRLTLIGFTDCQNERHQNASIRLARAEAVYRILPREVQSRISSKEAAPETECVTSNDTKADRTLNRSVAVQLEYSELDVEPEDVAPEPLAREKVPQATTDCTDEERKRLIQAYSVAQAMVETAMKIVGSLEKGTQEVHLLQKYFGRDAFEHRFHIPQCYADTLREWSQMGPVYDYHCRKKNVGDCGPGPAGQLTLGYVSFMSLYGLRRPHPVPYGDINICGSAFENNDEELAITVLHATSHRLDWRLDRENCPRTAGCKLSSEAAEDNADSYAQFAAEAFSRWY